jgi:hypothetical protein
VQPLQASTNKIRSKSTSNGDHADKAIAEEAMEADNLNQTNGNLAEDTIMTGEYLTLCGLFSKSISF